MIKRDSGAGRVLSHALAARGPIGAGRHRPERAAPAQGRPLRAPDTQAHGRRARSPQPDAASDRHQLTNKPRSAKQQQTVHVICMLTDYGPARAAANRFKRPFSRWAPARRGATSRASRSEHWGRNISAATRLPVLQGALGPSLALRARLRDAGAKVIMIISHSILRRLPVAQFACKLQLLTSESRPCPFGHDAEFAARLGAAISSRWLVVAGGAGGAGVVAWLGRADTAHEASAECRVRSAEWATSSLHWLWPVDWQSKLRGLKSGSMLLASPVAVRRLASRAVAQHRSSCHVTGPAFRAQRIGAPGPGETQRDSLGAGQLAS